MSEKVKSYGWRVVLAGTGINLALRMGARIYKRYRKYRFHIPNGRGDDTDIR